MPPQDLKQRVNTLEERVKILERLLNNSKLRQDDFGQLQVYSRDVQFKGKVYDADGNVVTEINP